MAAAGNAVLEFITKGAMYIASNEFSGSIAEAVTKNEELQLFLSAALGIPVGALIAAVAPGAALGAGASAVLLFLTLTLTSKTANPVSAERSDEIARLASAHVEALDEAMLKELSGSVPDAFKDATYTIKRGDTLSEIAVAHGTTVDALMACNKALISDPDKIYAGDVMLLKKVVPW